jgi:hypothetical protein
MVGVMEQDRAFFQQHPEQTYYLREIAPIERLEAQMMGKTVDAGAWMFVGQLESGTRFRQAFPKAGVPPIEEFKRLRQELAKLSPGKPKRPASWKGKGFGIVQMFVSETKV